MMEGDLHDDSAALAKYCASFGKLLGPAAMSVVRRSIVSPTERQTVDLRRIVERLRHEIEGRPT